MGQSLAKNLIHLIYSTKDRCPCLGEPIREELHRYSAGILDSLESPALLEVKRGSSKWTKTKGKEFADFQWQNGYGAFSVSQSSVSQVQSYIVGQSEHHMKTSFQEELRAFLRRYEMEFDEEYVWE